MFFFGVPAPRPLRHHEVDATKGSERGAAEGSHKGCPYAGARSRAFGVSVGAHNYAPPPRRVAARPCRPLTQFGSFYLFSII